ncbi:hypothetical protein AURDEDRAFT_102856 [Auricularia subglabra TFB-10046 SS5]|nr:hypothetical protein AURDEDRAFT_102856 [Auricularia subglabra TFB-10046 SS5]
MASQQPRRPLSPPFDAAPTVPKAARRAFLPALDELNAAVALLHEFFPWADIAALRQKLTDYSSLDAMSDLVANTLLDQGLPKASPAGTVTVLDARHLFRSAEYKRAVSKLLTGEFKGLSKATIETVLAEHGHSYTHSRETLKAVAKRSWRFALSAWWNRRTPISDLPPGPYRGATGSVELNRELQLLDAPAREKQRASDYELARKINEEEHASLGLLTEYVAACANGHVFCSECLLRTAQTSTSCAVRCISASTSESCAAPVPRAVLEAALPGSVLEALDDRAARFSVAQTNMRLLSCPFCPFAVWEETPEYHVRFQARLSFYLVLFALLQLLSVVSLNAFVIIACVHSCMSLTDRANRHFFGLLGADAGARAIAAKRRGMRFVCRNPDCGLASCMLCDKAWPSTASHNCAEDEKEKLRLFVEQAMAEAVKRTCPKCRCAFVKDGGCNKMTCPCGYKMCYLCRANLAEEGYKHFCQHFRPLGDGGPCRQCQRCHLYGELDDDMLARAAGKQAEKTYIAAHGDPTQRVRRSRRENALSSVEMERDLALLFWDSVLVVDSN